MTEPTNQHDFRRYVTPENLFLLLGGVLGVVFVFLNPPLQAPDEDLQFQRAYRVSEWRWPTVHDEELRRNAMGEIPAGLHQFIHTINARNIRHQPLMRTSWEEIRSMSDIPLEANSRDGVFFDNTISRPVLPYLPQAIGMTPARLLDLSPLHLLYCGRVANLVVWLFLVYLAIRVCPFGKWIVVVLALTPMSLFMSASLSPDAMTYGCAYLFTALVLRCIQDDEMLSTRRLVLLLILAEAVILAKLNYLPLATAVVVIPASKFGSRERWAGFGIAYVVILALTAAYVIDSARDYIVPATESAQAQLARTLSEPAAFPAAVWNTFVSGPVPLYETCIGRLGWLDTRLPKWVIGGYWLALLVAVAVSGSEARALSPRARAILVALVLLNAIVMVYRSYVLWTDAASADTIAFQGRYLIPLAPMLFLSLSPRRLPNRTTRSWLYAAIMVFVLAAGAASLHRLYARYYVPLRSVSGNLIPAGDFDNWPDESPLPKAWLSLAGYSLSLDSSTIERVQGEPSGYAAKQTWNKNDREDGVTNVFSAAASKATPAAWYLYRVRVKNESGAPIHVTAFEVMPPSGAAPLAGPRFQALPQGIERALTIPSMKGFQTYTSLFRTMNDPVGYVGLIMRCWSRADAFPLSVVWDDLSLFEVTSD